jgi:hypothetical protein
MFDVYKEIKQKISRFNNKKRWSILGVSLSLGVMAITSLFYLWHFDKFRDFSSGIFVSTIIFVPAIFAGMFGSSKKQIYYDDIKKGKIFSFLYDKDKPFDYFYDTINSLYLSEQAYSLSSNRDDEYIEKQNEMVLGIQEKIAYNQQALIKLAENKALNFESLPSIVQNKFNDNHSELIYSLKNFLGAMIQNHELLDEQSQIKQIMKLHDKEKLLLINENLCKIYENRIKHKEEEKLAQDFELTLNLPNTNKIQTQKTLSL